MFGIKAGTRGGNVTPPIKGQRIRGYRKGGRAKTPRHSKVSAGYRKRGRRRVSGARNSIPQEDIGDGHIGRISPPFCALHKFEEKRKERQAPILALEIGLQRGR